MSWTANNKLCCDGVKDCTEPVTMMDNKGYVYCTEHGLDRRDVRPCRKLKKWELRQLESGEPLASYAPSARPVATN